MKISEDKKTQGKYCCAYRCKNPPVKKKGGLCHKHYARKIRENDPVQIRYNQFRSNANRRGKKVFITLKQFREFCKRTGYLSKGKRGQNATLDRRCNAHDYHVWNLQILTNRQNAIKGNRFSGNNFNAPEDFEDLPF